MRKIPTWRQDAIEVAGEIIDSFAHHIAGKSRPKTLKMQELLTH